MVLAWDQAAGIAQLTGLDATRLIGMIVQAANRARLHKRNCRQFAQHLKLIGNLLQQLKISELKKYPETREPLELLEDSLRRAYLLVNSCQERSYFYLLAMGWNIVYHFRRAQNEIDQYLKIIPLITLVNNARVRERMETIEKDQHEYTLDEDDRKVQDIILQREQSKHDAMLLKKSLSCSYPNLGFGEALQKENEKLQLELHRSQATLDMSQCEVIQHLIDVTETVTMNMVSENDSPKKGSKGVINSASDANNEKNHPSDESRSKKSDCSTPTRKVPTILSGHEAFSVRGLHQHEEWHADLLGCCSEPLLCVKTLLFPCGTFSRVATVASNRHISSAEACNELMAYSLVLSCCCYTCCVRRRLRMLLNIQGGWFDDFLSHFLCCCCALVQEWREVEIRGVKGPMKTETSAPSLQYMQS